MIPTKHIYKVRWINLDSSKNTQVKLNFAMSTLPAGSNLKHVKVRWVLIYLIPISISLFFLGLNPRNQNYAAIVYSLVVLPLCFLLIKKCDQNKISLGEIFGKFPKENVWLKLVGVAIIGMFFMIGSLMVSGSLISMVLPYSSPTSNSQANSFTPASSPVDLILQFIFIAIIAPFAEEFLFRGIILNRWIEKWGVTKALIASSCFFGILHINVIGASVYGLLLGILYLRYQTLWVTIFCHFVNNATVFLLFYLLNNNIESGEVLSENINDSRVSFLLVGVGISVICLTLLWFSKLRLPKGYVQPSHAVKVIDNARYNCPSNTYTSRLVGGLIIAVISGVLIPRSDIYKSVFTSEPYKSLTSLSKDSIDDYKTHLEELIKNDSTNKNSSLRTEAITNTLLLMGDIYEKEAKVIKNPNAAKMAIKKSQKIKELAREVTENKTSISLKLLREAD